MVRSLLAVLGLLVPVGFVPGQPASTPADADLAAWVDARVRDWEPTAPDRRFDEVGWLTDIRAALRLAHTHERPVFLFTHDGRMAVGRC